jgi:hypothetical protein
VREAARVSRGGGSRRTNVVQNPYGDHGAHTEECKCIVIKVFAMFPQISCNACLETSLNH